MLETIDENLRDSSLGVEGAALGEVGAADLGEREGVTAFQELVVAIECSSSVRRNVGTLIRCSAALGARTLLIIGNRRISTHGSHGAQTRVKLLHFFDWNEALAYLRQQAERVVLYGVSKSQSSSSQEVSGFKFTEAACEDSRTTIVVFVVGNREWLISEDIRSQLDAELHLSLPQPSLAHRFPYESVLTICLHCFAMSPGGKAMASAREQPVIAGEKFVLDACVNLRGRVQRGSTALRGGTGGSGAGDGCDPEPDMGDTLSSLFIQSST